MKQRRRQTNRATLALGCLLLATAPHAALAGGESAERGRLLFRIHCASCHGVNATGDGPLAEELRRAPKDLTRLAEAAGGTFPAERAARAIDGREGVTGHGPREMPIWGLSFQQGGRDADQEEEVRGRIRDLVAFLGSIQPGAQGPSGEPPAPD